LKLQFHAALKHL